MYIIEPCCVRRHLRELRDSIASGKRKEFEGFGDLSLTELLPAILMRYTETSILIAAPSLPDQAAEIIMKWMSQQWARRDGKGKLDVVSHLTIIADLDAGMSPLASEWLKRNPFDKRLTLVSLQQPDTAILLPDFAITGPVNMRYGYNFVATATTITEEVEELWRQFEKKAEPAEVPAEEPAKPRRKPATRRKKAKAPAAETD